MRKYSNALVKKFKVLNRNDRDDSENVFRLLHNSVRNKRSYCDDISVRSYAKKMKDENEFETDHILKDKYKISEMKTLMKPFDKFKVFSLMRDTFQYRRQWIYTSNPNATEILMEFNKFRDLPETVI
jgi:hypothetical protein